jgi:hypothetical protein
MHNEISHRDFSARLKNMINQNILCKEDSNVRGTSVGYSLTKKALRENQLKILGIDAKVERRKKLYKLMLFYEAYKRRTPLTEKQLHAFLKKIGCAPKKLEQIGKGRSPFHKSVITTFKPIKGVEILRFGESKPKSGSKTGFYYIVTPGFSSEEFIQYLRLLKRGKDPRPFSTTSPRAYVPFIRYTEFTEVEVADAIELFHQDGLIKPIIAVFPGETRYQIVDDSLLEFIHSVWLINMMDFHSLIGRLAYLGKPTAEDKNYLSLFVGKKGADKMLAFAYHIRKSQKEEKDKTEIEKNKVFMQKLNDDRKSVIQAINEKYKKLINENEIAAALIQEICFSPCIP